MQYLYQKNTGKESLMERYKYIIKFFIIAAVISALIFASGCKPAESSEEVQELKEKIAELEEKLEESESESASEGKESEEKLAEEREGEEEKGEESEESAGKETEGSNVEAPKDKVCLIDTPP